MPISIVCDHCFAEFRVKDELAGKRIRCRSCEEVIKVPGGEAKTRPPARPAPRPSKPALEELADWDESEESEAELPRLRPKKTVKKIKKKRRSQASQIDLGAWGAKIASFNVGPLLLQIAVVGILVVFGLGFYSPTAANVCFGLLILARALMVIGAVIAVFVIAAREHVMCFVLCFIPLYFFWFVLSRFDRTGLAFVVWLGGTFGGWAVSSGVVAAYGVAGVPVNVADPFGERSRRYPVAKSIQRIAPVLNGETTTLLPLSSVSVPAFKMSLVHPSPGGAAGPVYQVHCEGSGSDAGGLMTLRLRLPAGEHQPQTLPCILIAPAGATLLSGMNLDDISQTAETAPYVQAGYAVVEYSVDGAIMVPNAPPTAGHYLMFAAAQAGVVNGRNALEFVLSKVPQVNPNRIFTAGHSSAGVLALLLAEHEPRIKGCIAYAPATDVEARLKPNLAQMDGERSFPGVYAFIQRSSPKTHAANLNCPVFLFHAQDDSNEPIGTTRAFQALLQSLGKQSTFIEVPTGDHYDSMIQQGIPAAINWLQQLPGNR